MAIDSYPSPPSENAPASTSSMVSYGDVRICLKDGHDTNGGGMICDIGRHHTFENLFGHFKARSCKNCRAPDEMRFKKDAASLSLADLVEPSDTPSKVGLRAGDKYVIKVWSNVPGLQCSDCKSKGYPKTVGVDASLAIKTPPPCANSGSSETVTLLVKDQTGFETSLKMLNTTSFAYLMETYATRALRDRRFCRFLYDGEKLMPKENPKKLALINGDTVDVHIEQLGG